MADVGALPGPGPGLARVDHGASVFGEADCTDCTDVHSNAQNGKRLSPRVSRRGLCSAARDLLKRALGSRACLMSSLANPRRKAEVCTSPCTR